MLTFFRRVSALCAVVLLPYLGWAQPTIFTRILDTTTPLPPDNRPLYHFADNETASRKGSSVAFLSIPSFENELPRLFRLDNGNISFVVGPQTRIPGSFYNFSSISEPSMSGTDTAFTGYGGPNQDGGVYRFSISTLSVIADKTVTPPGATVPFIGAATPLIDGPTTTFAGFSGGPGIYRKRNSELIRIADWNTNFPGMGRFSEVHLSPARSGGYNGFLANFDGARRTGIYQIDPADHVSLIADTNMIAPGRTTPFLYFAAVPAVDGPDAAFIAALEEPISGLNFALYRRVSGSMELIVPDGQAAPGGGIFHFGSGNLPVSLSNGHVAFMAAVDPIGNGIYTDVGGTLHKVIRYGDTLDGKRVDFLRMNNNALDGESLIFLADFTDGSQAVYMATVPEPALIALAPLLVFGRRPRTKVKPAPSFQCSRRA